MIPDSFATTVITTSQPVMVSMHNPLWDSQHNLQTSSNFSSIAVPFIVTSISLLIVMLVALAVRRICQYRKKASAYTYSELTTGLSEETA